MQIPIKRVQTLASALPPAARQLQKDSRFVTSPVVETIVQFIEQRAEMTLRRLRDVVAMSWKHEVQ